MLEGQTALLLGGGGARAAYQVGVLKAFAACFSRHHPIPFTILCGNSAGAINACALGAYASCFHLSVLKLEWVWRHLHTSKVYHSKLSQVLRHYLALALKQFQSQPNTLDQDAVSLLNNNPLRKLLTEVIDFPRIDHNIQRGYLHALSLETSCYDDSLSYSFFQGHPSINNWQGHKRRGVRAQLQVEHLMASAAMPLIFPSIQLPQGYFGDGGLHQSAPLSAPIRLGATKIMSINLDCAYPQQQTPHGHPSFAGLGGHLLDSIFSDPLNSDLERLAKINETLRQLPPHYLQQYQQIHDQKLISSLVIRPSEDLAEIAKHYYKQLPQGIRALLRIFGGGQHSDPRILSYVAFVPDYIHQLIQLGYEDALCHIDEIKAFIEL